MTVSAETERQISMPVGVVVRESPGATRWVKHAWKAVDVLPGAAAGGWRELRREGEVAEFHAATADIVLHRAETEAYLVALNSDPPVVWAILQHVNGPTERPELLKVTASAYEAQDHADNGDDIVEPIAMPEGLAAWIAAFVDRHHREEEFIKRKRRPYMEDREEDGIGDARVRQTADVYRNPRSLKGKGQ